MTQDILLDDKGDLKIVNGDFVIGDSENQEIETLLVNAKGEFKEFPTTCADIERLVKSRAGQTAVLKEIKKQLKEDNFDFSTVKIDGFDIETDAKRTI